MAIVTEIRFNHMPRLAGLARQRAAAAVSKAAHDVEGHAKDLVLVDTGNLKSSIQTEFESDLTVLVGSRNVEYAIHNEYGTRYWLGKSFMRPAAEKMRPAFIAAMKQIAEM